MMYIESKEFGNFFNNKKEFERTDKNFYINRGENFRIHPSSDRFVIEFRFYHFLQSEPEIYIENIEKVPSYILDWLCDTDLKIVKN